MSGKEKMQALTLRNSLANNTFIWWIGWLSLGMIEATLKFSYINFTLSSMLFPAILIYSLTGVILGFIFGIIIFFVNPFLKGLRGRYNLIHFSMAFCIFTILLFYNLVYFLNKEPNFITLSVIFKSLFLFSSSIGILIILPFFLQWIERKGNLFLAYLALQPSLWVITTLKVNRHKGLVHSLFQSAPFSNTLILILGSLLGFFLFYFLLSLGARFLKRWNVHPRLRLYLFGSVLLMLFLIFIVKAKEDNSIDVKKVNINAPAGKPNIILITLDTVRADHVSSYGYTRETTPNLDSFSQEGVLYKHAYATASWTLPSHASLFTGMYPNKHGAHYNSNVVFQYFDKTQRGEKFALEQLFKNAFAFFKEENHTLAEILSERGYRTAGVIGGIMCSALWGTGQGFAYYNEKISNIVHDIKIFLIYQTVRLVLPLDDFLCQYGYHVKRLASRVNEAAFQWLEKNYDQPFFLFLNYFDAHDPYLPPPPYDKYFGEIDKSILRKYNPEGGPSYITSERTLSQLVIDGHKRLSPEEKNLFISLYDGEIRYLDDCLNALFEKLKALKIYDNSLIIVTSDHGEAFGEHNKMYHSITLYEEVLRVPLIVKYPYSSRRGVVEKKVSLVDIFPTVLTLLGYPLPAGIDGEPIDDSDHPIIAEVYTDLNVAMSTSRRYLRDLKAVYQGKDKYIWASNGLNELYDLEKDPGEEGNLIEKFPERAEVMQKTLSQCLVTVEPPVKNEAIKINKSTEEKLRALGYVR